MTSSNSSPPAQDLQSPGAKAGIFIATPAYLGTKTKYNASLLALLSTLRELRIPAQVAQLPGESNIDRARAILTSQFLDSDAEVLCFIDADIGFDAGHVYAMYAEGKSIIGAVTCRKEIDWALVVAAARAYPTASPEQCALAGQGFNFTGAQIPEDLSEPLLVRAVGTGLMMIRRDVIEKMCQFYADELGFMFKGRRCVDLFKTSIGQGKTVEQTGTDYMFCRRAYLCGFNTYLAPWTETTHTGDFTFKASLKGLSAE